MLKFLKNAKKQNGGNPWTFYLQPCSLVQSKYSIIDNIFLSYNLVEHYFS